MHRGRLLLALEPSLSERQHEPVKDVWEGREVWGGSRLRQQLGEAKLQKMKLQIMKITSLLLLILNLIAGACRETGVLDFLFQHFVYYLMSVGALGVHNAAVIYGSSSGGKDTHERLQQAGKEDRSFPFPVSWVGSHNYCSMNLSVQLPAVASPTLE